MASKLEHRNIIKVLNFGATEGGAPFMVLEYFDGISLKQYLDKHGRLDPRHALRVFELISDSLAYAHGKGVYHRDLKSSNVLLSGITSRAEDLDIRLIDFGLALVKQLHQEPTIVNGRSVVGTPAYMPPDQAMGLSYDARSEIYAMGCVMFEALTGQVPFQADTALETISLHVNAPVPTLSSATGSTFAPAIEDIISRALAKKPEDRFQSMGEFHARLSEIAPKIAAAQREQENRTEPDKQALDLPPPPHRRPKRQALFTMALIGLATVFGIGLLIMAFAKTVGDIFDGLREPAAKNPPPKFALELDEDISILKWKQSKWGDNLQWWKRFSVTDSDIKAELPQLKMLDYVSFWREDVSSVGLSYLVDTNIKGLYLKNTSKIDGKALEYVSKMKALEVLHIEADKQLHDEDLEPIRHLTKLKILSLGENNFTDGTLELVSSLKNLEVLYLNLVPLNGSGFKYLGSLKKLRKLNLSDTITVSPENFNDLAAIKSLEILYVDNTKFGDRQAEKLISALPLKALDVGRTLVSDEGIDNLLKSKTLKVLFIGTRKTGRYAGGKLDPRIRCMYHAPFKDEI